MKQDQVPFIGDQVILIINLIVQLIKNYYMSALIPGRVNQITFSQELVYIPGLPSLDLVFVAALFTITHHIITLVKQSHCICVKSV